jgi:hypothetical protein
VAAARLRDMGRDSANMDAEDRALDARHGAAITSSPVAAAVDAGQHQVGRPVAGMWRAPVTQSVSV